MLIELCDSRLKTTVSAPVDADGYEVTNLSSGRREKRKQGYRPAPYVGGCVEVDVMFEQPVALSHISFSTRCGTSQSQATVRVSRDYPITSSDNKHQGFFVAATSVLVKDKITSLLFSKILDTNERTLKNFSSFSYLIPADTVPTQLFRQDVARQCRSVRISVNTFGASRSLWDLSLIGSPAKGRNLPPIYKSVLSLQCPAKMPQIRTPSASTTSSSKQPSSASSSESSAETPAEFLDPITLKMMNCPMILPSGNIVDSATLEKHAIEERTWGRVPSDPFTGIAFNKESAPIVHTSLKQRIDEWRGNGARSTGVNTDIPLTTQILDRQTRSLRPDSLREARCKRFISSTPDLALTSQPNKKRPHPEATHSSEVAHSSEVEITHSSTDSYTSSSDVARKRTKMSAHEQQLEDSLQSALNALL